MDLKFEELSRAEKERLVSAYGTDQGMDATNWSFLLEGSPKTRPQEDRPLIRAAEAWEQFQTAWQNIPPDGRALLLCRLLSNEEVDDAALDFDPPSLKLAEVARQIDAEVFGEARKGRRAIDTGHRPAALVAYSIWRERKGDKDGLPRLRNSKGEIRSLYLFVGSALVALSPDDIFGAGKPYDSKLEEAAKRAAHLLQQQ